MNVARVYERVTCPLLEPAGFTLGLVSFPQFSAYLVDIVNDFCRMTGLAKIFITQTINYGIGQYTTPDAQLSVEQLFISGRFLPASNLESIDNSQFQWKRKTGVPKVWHQDGLPINTVEMVVAPNWQGALYDSAAPPAVQLIGNEAIGNFSGIVNTNGTVVTLVSGSPFQATDATWQGKTFVIAMVQFTVASVTDVSHLILTGTAGVQNNAPWSVRYPVNIPAADRNLTTYGSRLPGETSYALTDTIPLLPDSAAMYLAWGVLQKIYSDDSELKDKQKAMYCGARYMEGVNLFRAALLEHLGDNDDE